MSYRRVKAVQIVEKSACGKLEDPLVLAADWGAGQSGSNSTRLDHAGVPTALTFQSVLRSVECSPYTYFQGFGRALAVM